VVEDVEDFVEDVEDVEVVIVEDFVKAAVEVVAIAALELLSKSLGMLYALTGIQ
jgi:hypothetical protein